MSGTLTRIRPKVLLWALLAGLMGLAIFSFIQALVWEQKAPAFNPNEPQMHTTTEVFNSRINTNTDVAQLRRLVIHFNDFDERDKSYRYYHAGQMWFGYAFLYGFISAILAFAIYGMREKMPAPMKGDTTQKPTVEKISIWILEALEREWRQEPDVAKCRLASEVLGPLKTEHSITDTDIDNALRFMCSPNRQYLTILNRDGGQAMIPSDNGLTILGKIQLHRIEEKAKKKWSRADKISLASLVFSVFTFVAGYYLGQQKTEQKNMDKPAITTTNTISVAPSVVTK